MTKMRIGADELYPIYELIPVEEYGGEIIEVDPLFYLLYKKVTASFEDMQKKLEVMFNDQRRIY